MRAAPGPAARVPSTIDSDIYAYTVGSTSSRTYFAAAGRLKLALTSGSTTQYKGSFVDYVGNKSYKASADAGDANAPTLKLESKNGKFSFRLTNAFGSSFYNGTALSRPSKLKVPTSSVYLAGATHATRTATYSVLLTERSGAINNPVEYAGSLTMAYDAFGRISGGQITVGNSKGKNVTHALSASGYYSSVFFYTVAKVDKRYFGLSGTVTGTSFDGTGFAADGSKTSQWVFEGTA